ncbi:MAG: hypothetical protein EOP18_00020 [Rhizobiaceae bacterium]|nr:MAG: hypothetical protein EOP18_00020 [Rhizobiaceae bacterium]
METLGAEIIGPVAFPEDVLMLIRGDRPDVAIFDAALNEYDREAVFGLLHRTDVPFVRACRAMTFGGEEGCVPLTDTDGDLTVLSLPISA